MSAVDHAAVFLAQHALKRGYEATIYTYNLTTFDPTWFQAPGIDISERLRLQARAKQDRPLRRATEGYLDFLALGGQLRFEDLTTGLLRRHLKAGLPVLTGLSATYLYRCAREYGPKDDADDVRGAPAGHFVVLAGYDSVSRTIQVADPYLDNPLANGHHYTVPIERVVGSILLGVLTYDANLLVLRPKQRGQTTRKTGGPPGQ